MDRVTTIEQPASVAPPIGDVVVDWGGNSQSWVMNPGREIVPSEATAQKKDANDAGANQTETITTSTKNEQKTRTANDILNTSDPHEVLGLKSGASPSEVKSALRRLMREWHTDVSKDPQAEAVDKHVLDAYEKLSPKKNGKERVELVGDVPKNKNESDSLFYNSEIVKGLIEAKSGGKIGNIPEDIEEIQAQGGCSWTECLTLVAMLAIDASLGGGRGLSSFMENYLQDEISFNLLIPTLSNFGVKQETLEKIIERKGREAKGIFQLEAQMLETIVDRMTKYELQDLVNTLTPEEQKNLLFSEKRVDPYKRLSDEKIKKLFSEEKLGKDYLDKLAQKLKIESKPNS